MCPLKSWGGQGGGQHTAPWPGQESWLGPQAGLCMCSTEGAGLPGSCPPGGSTPLSFHINKNFNRFLANWQEKYM